MRLVMETLLPVSLCEKIEKAGVEGRTKLMTMLLRRAVNYHDNGSMIRGGPVVTVYERMTPQAEARMVRIEVFLYEHKKKEKSRKRISS